MAEQSMIKLEGAVVLITGAGRGIGRGLASILAKSGATVIATSRTQTDVDCLVEEIEGADGLIAGYALDVRDLDQIREVFETVTARYGRIDVLVNNAGLGFNHDALDVTEADWDEIMAVNLKGLFFCCQTAAQLMIPNQYGRILNMSSQAGLVGIPRHAVYSASKGGVNLLTKVLALEWAEYGITVNAIAPTFIRTPGTAERLDQPNFRASIISRIPVGRVGTVEDVAAAVTYLASPAASLVTGTILSVDGGWTAQ